MDADQILEWAENYLNHRKLVFKNIEQIIRKKNMIQVKYNEDIEEQLFPTLCLEDFKKAIGTTKITLVTLNSKKNFKYLIENWKKYSSFTELKIMFINPKSIKDKKWVVKPYVHNMVSDGDALVKGLKSMFGTVDSI